MQINDCKFIYFFITSEPQKAAQCFTEARDGVSNEPFLKQKILQTDEAQVRKLEVK
jgi:hypothetical protein